MTPPILLRRAVESDSDLFFELARDPTARANSLNPDAYPTRESHADWFARALKSPTTKLFVICSTERLPVGVLRLRHLDSEGFQEISITIRPECRSRGYGTKVLKLLTEIYSSYSYAALIAKTNEASKKAFSRAGFKLRIEEVHENYEVWIWEPSLWARIKALFRRNTL